MEFIQELIKMIQENILIVVGVIAACILFYALQVFGAKKSGQKLAKMSEDYLKKHPDSAKVYVKKDERINVGVDRVDNEMPQLFQESISKMGIYLSPGQHVLNVQATVMKSRPKVTGGSKTTTTSYGPLELSVEVEANSSYTLTIHKEEFALKKRG